MTHKQRVYPELQKLKERLANLSYLWRTSAEEPPPSVLKEVQQIVHLMRVNLSVIETQLTALKQQSGR